MTALKLKEAFKTVQPKYLSVLKYFLIAATIAAVIGIFLALHGSYREETQYLTILSATLACQGAWGAVLCDCMHRRLNRE